MASLVSEDKKSFLLECPTPPSLTARPSTRQFSSLNTSYRKLKVYEKESSFGLLAYPIPASVETRRISYILIEAIRAARSVYIY